jgi:hypothetical protein
MAKNTIERAARAEKDRVDKARKTQDKADKTEKDRVDKARKTQDKADKTEKDRVYKDTDRERSRVFEEFLSETSDKIRRCCEPCNYRVARRGEYQPCKMGHDDSGPLKEFCADCSEPRYRSKPATAD